MTQEFLRKLIKLFPNNYSLGEAVRRYQTYKDNNPNVNSIALEKEFLDNFQNKA